MRFRVRKRQQIERRTGRVASLQVGLPLAVAMAMAIAFLLLTGKHNQQPLTVEARSFVNKIPGLQMMKELTNELMGAIGNQLETNEIVRALGAKVNGCLEGATDILNEACGRAPTDPDARRNVSEIIRSRGFLAEEHDVITRDGYILTIQRIINPLVNAGRRKSLKPVILQHGLMSSSVDWVINSPHVRPAPFPRPISDASEETATDEQGDLGLLDDQRPETAPANSLDGHRQQQQQQQQLQNIENGRDSQEHPNALGFYLANEGYDVFLANSRGNIYAQRHVSLNSWQPKFWSFTFDEQISFDLPDTLDYVQRLTNHTKVGYVGHSQGTTMALGLLADQPEYADVMEPIILLAPVAYCNHALSPVRHFAVYTPIFQHINMWFGSSNIAVRYLAPIVCGPEVIKKDVCANLIFLSTGFDEEQFDMARASAYLAHMPSGTSVKNIAHWGQEVNSKRFAHFDHGILANQIRYNRTSSPDYELAKIRAKSISLFTAENDWLASPKDVARLKAELQVPYKLFNISELNPKWNHIDFVYGLDAGTFVNTQIVEQFHKYDDNDGGSTTTTTTITSSR